jgi:hypothetical protein
MAPYPGRARGSKIMAERPIRCVSEHGVGTVLINRQNFELLRSTTGNSQIAWRFRADHADRTE